MGYLILLITCLLGQILLAQAVPAPTLYGGVAKKASVPFHPGHKPTYGFGHGLPFAGPGLGAFGVGAPFGGIGGVGLPGAFGGIGVPGGFGGIIPGGGGVGLAGGLGLKGGIGGIGLKGGYGLKHGVGGFAPKLSKGGFPLKGGYHGKGFPFGGTGLLGHFGVGIGPFGAPAGFPLGSLGGFGRSPFGPHAAKASYSYKHATGGYAQRLGGYPGRLRGGYAGGFAPPYTGQHQGGKVLRRVGYRAPGQRIVGGYGK